MRVVLSKDEVATAEFLHKLRKAFGIRPLPIKVRTMTEEARVSGCRDQGGGQTIIMISVHLHEEGSV